MEDMLDFIVLAIVGAPDAASLAQFDFPGEPEGLCRIGQHSNASHAGGMGFMHTQGMVLAHRHTHPCTPDMGASHHHRYLAPTLTVCSARRSMHNAFEGADFQLPPVTVTITLCQRATVPLGCVHRWVRQYRWSQV
jgi:hypothetical protein